MTFDLFFELAWKSVLCAGSTLLLLRLFRSRSAAQKSMVAHIGLVALLLLPLGIVGLPEVPLAAPVSIVEAIAEAEPAANPVAAANPNTLTAAPIHWEALALWAYAGPALLLLLLVFLAVARLQLLRARADVLVDPRWLTALAAAQRRLGFKHGTALLVSGELNSPISWGVVRPIIIVDPKAAADTAGAEAIIAHELAHVAHLDWLKLLAGRVATALFWFNPLVWILARCCHHLCEEAADDAVLRSDIAGPYYAELLVGAARHANGRTLIAANGVAPSRNSLARRVAAVLDASRPRAPARFGWAVASVVAALGVNGALAAAEPVVRAPFYDLAAEAVPARAARTAASLPSAGSLALAEALIEAAERGDLAAMAQLIEAGASPDAALPDEGTSLIAAARAGRADAVAFLLARGADVNLGMPGDGNPLIAAAGAGRTEIVRLLLDRGADIEAAVPQDENALITASRRGRPEVVRLLVARGADVHRAVDGRTPLAMARAGGHRAIATLLTEAGAMR